MDIIIQSLGFTASEHLKEFIAEKMSKLEHHEEIIRANVTLFEGADGNPENQFCEIRMEVPGNDHFAKRNSDAYEKAITETVDVLQKVMRKSKDKMIESRRTPIE